jgi:hypothetical protein
MEGEDHLVVAGFRHFTKLCEVLTEITRTMVRFRKNIRTINIWLIHCALSLNMYFYERCVNSMRLGVGTIPNDRNSRPCRRMKRNCTNGIVVCPRNVSCNSRCGENLDSNRVLTPPFYNPMRTRAKFAVRLGPDSESIALGRYL